jgi:hypothetical protein
MESSLLEDKSSEEQIAVPPQQPAEKIVLGSQSDEAKREAHRRQAEHERQKQALNLQRENILSQRTSHPARRAALEAALTQIESQLTALG